MVTLETCFELWKSLKRIKMRCRFKYSKTNNREYSNLADEVESLLESLEWKHIDDVDFNKLEFMKNDLYLRMRSIDTNDNGLR